LTPKYFVLDGDKVVSENMNGGRGEHRRLTAPEVGVMIRMFREGQGIKRAALAADANMSEKTLERAESGQGVNEESSRRIARALGMQEDVFLKEHHIPAPEEAIELLRKRNENLEANFTRLSVAALRGDLRQTLAIFRTDALLAGDQHVAEKDMSQFASLKQSWWDWNSVTSDIQETELIEGAKAFLGEVSDFEARGYVIKGGVAKRRRRDGTPYSLCVITAFRKPKGSASTPTEVLLPKNEEFW
jgi:transcriptional regulator with XRE-family HTH domain